MNNNAKRWVEVLKSGEYKQAEAFLHTTQENRFCCLGVACELFMQENPDLLKRELFEDENAFSYYVDTVSGEAHNDVLPEVVQHWLGLGSPSGMYGYSGNSLTNANDTGATFEQIAEIIESEPEGLFAE